MTVNRTVERFFLPKHLEQLLDFESWLFAEVILKRTLC